MTKIWKEIGLELKKPDGSFLMPDDPLFDPIYAHLARRRKPLLAHLAEPREAWLPLDPKGLHHGYYSRNPEWHLYGKPEYPSHEALMTARDHIAEKHPGLVLIGAPGQPKVRRRPRSPAASIATRTFASRCRRGRAT